MQDSTIRIRRIELRLRELEAEKSDLLAQLEGARAECEPPASAGKVSILGRPASSSVPATPDEKIDLFLKLFRCREDVYPKRWENSKTGKAGYAPACRLEWKPGVCEKPKIKCSDCVHQSFPSLDREAVRNHLLRAPESIVWFKH